MAQILHRAGHKVNRGVAMKSLLLGGVAAFALVGAALASGGIDNTPRIPEPSTIALLAAGGVALVWARTRHRRRK